MITSSIYFIIKLGLLQLYPTYISYKALKVNDQKQFQSLLTFWVVSITYLSVEYFSDIFFFWFPFYNEIKLIIVLWLILPQTQGTFVFYTHYLDPFLTEHEVQIDKAILDLQAKLKETIILYGKQLIEFLKKSITDMIFKGHEETSHGSSVNQSQTLSSVPAQEGGYFTSPYHLFSTLVTATTNRIQQQEQQLKNQSNEITEKGLNRSDSQDSIQSYVNIKETKSNTSSPEIMTRRNNASNATWGEYISSWVRKPSSESNVTETIKLESKKQD